MIHTPATGDIWKYTRPSYSRDRKARVVHILILDDSTPDFYYTCLNLDTNEVGDWMIDYGDEFDNWEYIA